MMMPPPTPLTSASRLHPVDTDGICNDFPLIWDERKNSLESTIRFCHACKLPNGMIQVQHKISGHGHIRVRKQPETGNITVIMSGSYYISSFLFSLGLGLRSWMDGSAFQGRWIPINKDFLIGVCPGTVFTGTKDHITTLERQLLFNNIPAYFIYFLCHKFNYCTECIYTGGFFNVKTTLQCHTLHINHSAQWWSNIQPKEPDGGKIVQQLQTDPLKIDKTLIWLSLKTTGDLYWLCSLSHY